MGGWLGIRLGHAHAARVGHIIALNPAGVEPSEEQLAALRELYSIRSYKKYLSLMKLMWHRVPLLFFPFSVMGFYQYARRPEFSGVIDTVRPEHFVDRLLPELKVPLSIIWGTSDRLFGGQNVGRIMAAMNDAIHYYPVAGAGHMPQMEKPREVYRILDSIMDRG
jgi:pimeloyl-ACP methyl ester carboxylesterase